MHPHIVLEIDAFVVIFVASYEYRSLFTNSMSSLKKTLHNKKYISYSLLLLINKAKESEIN